jgi:flagellin-like protein
MVYEVVRFKSQASTNININPKGGINTKMKLSRSRKALSPVVASIILIAVTVAVSIAVAAWMGALTFNFMGSSSITVTNVSFQGVSADANNTIVLTLKNTGTKQVTIAQVKVNNTPMNFTGTTTLIAGQTGAAVTISTVNWVDGNPYKIELYDASGQGVGSTQQNAPGA